MIFSSKDGPDIRSFCYFLYPAERQEAACRVSGNAPKLDLKGTEYQTNFIFGQSLILPRKRHSSMDSLRSKWDAFRYAWRALRAPTRSSDPALRATVHATETENAPVSMVQKSANVYLGRRFCRASASSSSGRSGSCRGRSSAGTSACAAAAPGEPSRSIWPAPPGLGRATTWMNEWMHEWMNEGMN
mgnify:CR=1 FL=1